MANEAGFLTDAAGNPISSTNALPTSATLSGAISGSSTPSDAYANPTDGLDSVALTMGWDPTAAKWVRVQTVHANPGSLLVNNPSAGNLLATVSQATASSLNAAVIGTHSVSNGGLSTPTDAANTQAFVQLWSPTDSDYDGMISASADGLLATAGVLAAGDVIYNGTTWDRRRAGVTTGSALVEPAKATASAITAVSIANTSTQVLAANANRKGATIYADGTLPTNLYIALSTVASSTSYTVQLSSTLPYYEVPFAYTGAIFHIGSSATGTLRVTELT